MNRRGAQKLIVKSAFLTLRQHINDTHKNIKVTCDLHKYYISFMSPRSNSNHVRNMIYMYVTYQHQKTGC